MWLWFVLGFVFGIIREEKENYWHILWVGLSIGAIIGLTVLLLTTSIGNMLGILRPFLGFFLGIALGWGLLVDMLAATFLFILGTFIGDILRQVDIEITDEAI